MLEDGGEATSVSAFTGSGLAANLKGEALS